MLGFVKLQPFLAPKLLPHLGRQDSMAKAGIPHVALRTGLLEGSALGFRFGDNRRVSSITLGKLAAFLDVRASHWVSYKKLPFQ